MPLDDTPDLAATGAKTVPAMMPYIAAIFIPHQSGERPNVVPKGAINFDILGPQILRNLLMKNLEKIWLGALLHEFKPGGGN